MKPQYKKLLFNIASFLPDKLYLSLIFKRKMGYWINWKTPKTYSEKLQYLKIYDRNPLYSKMVDKYEVKKLVSAQIGDKYVIPTLGVWNKFEDINFNELPEQFVLKCTHDSGGLVICKSKADLDIDKAKMKLQDSLGVSYYKVWREWPYKNVEPRIIAEEYMEDITTGELRDYKFFCFHGKAKMMFIASERQSSDEETKFDFFDMDFKHLPFLNGHPNAKITPEKPKCFIEMKQLAEKLSVNIPHVRIDFYEVNGKVYFGEMTFAHWGGFMPYEPPEWDIKIGEWLDLNNI